MTQTHYKAGQDNQGIDYDDFYTRFRKPAEVVGTKHKQTIGDSEQ